MKQFPHPFDCECFECMDPDDGDYEEDDFD
jgi:hypothetical protein